MKPLPPKKFIPPTKEKILHFRKDDKIIIDVWAFSVKKWDRASGKLNLKYAGRITGIKTPETKDETQNPETV